MTDQKTKKVFCAGIARNCEESLVETVEIVEKAIPKGWSREWLIVESDSTDKTVETLAKLSAGRENFGFVSEGELEPRLPVLTERLAYCRNIYLQAAMNSNSNFLLIVDLDGIVTGIPDGLLKELLEEEGDWAALFANQSGPYYDLAALRHQHWNPEDPFMYQDFLLSVGYKRRAAAKKAIVEKMLLIQSSAPRIRVDSAFGGMAIYRLSHLPTSSRYKGIVDGQQVCEHVPLNSSLSAIDLGLYIEPKLIIAKYTEHTYQLSKLNRLLANLLAIFVMPLGEDKFESAVIRLAKLHQRLLR